MSQKKKKRAAPKQQRPASRAPLFIVLGGVVLIGLAVVLLASSGQPAPKATPEVTGAPSLKADKDKVDLGTVPLGQTVTVAFDLSNVGDQVLRFTEAPYIEVAQGC